MQGLIFVTWEKYLSERFGSQFLNAYRDSIVMCLPSNSGSQWTRFTAYNA